MRPWGGCDNEHLGGHAAIECLRDDVEPVAGATPVQRCDGCRVAGEDWSWNDEEAAAAVAAATGRRVLLDPSMLQPFVLPALERTVGPPAAWSGPGR